MQTYFLGTHMIEWLRFLWMPPLFINRHRFIRRVKRRAGESVVNSLQRVRKQLIAVMPWALDSGGFTVLNEHGRWLMTPREYADEVNLYAATIGSLRWAASMDYMCEPIVLKKTCMSVAQHQRLTIENYETLLGYDIKVPIVPVLQGWEHDDYLRHLDQYAARGHDLVKLPTVGIGSVCRRQDTDMAEKLIAELAQFGLKIHGFGFKTEGLRRSHQFMVSADSMAWSKAGKERIRLDGCRHESCQNCPRWARKWYDDLMRSLGLPVSVKDPHSMEAMEALP